MGTNKLVERIKSVEVPSDLSPFFLKVESALGQLEEALESNYPAVNKETTIPHLNLQQAWYDYCRRWTEGVKIMRLGDFKVVAPFKIKIGRKVPNFVKYLQHFGPTGFGKYVISKKGVERASVFLAINEKPRLIGILESRKEYIRYSGYVPISVPESEFFRAPVYHLSSSDLGIGNCAYVRLFAEIKDGKSNRLDGFSERGIEFP